jgi:hypothetical protein
MMLMTIQQTETNFNSRRFQMVECAGVKPVKTFFDRRYAMTQLLFPVEYKRFAADLGLSDWLEAPAKYAALYGGALLYRNNGDLETFTRRNGEIVKAVYPVGSWGWGDEKSE